MSKKKKHSLKFPVDLPQLVSSYLEQNSGKAFNPKQLLSKLNLRGLVDSQVILDTLRTLVSQNKVQEVQFSRFQFRYEHEFYEGIIEFNRDGYAFVTPQEGIKIQIFPDDTGKALFGDLVRVETYSKKSGSYKGRVQTVLHRNKTEFVGTVFTKGRNLFFDPNDPKIHVTFKINDKSTQYVKNGERALVRLTNWYDIMPEAEIIHVLGAAGSHQAEIHTIILEFGFQTEFSPEAIQESANIPAQITEKEILNRKDFRQTTTFTIDPVDAKDFDDALSFKILPNGNTEIGIHIADVTHYVLQGSALDRDAAYRATSVYLVDRTLPMLPEKLSNELCSLRPNEDKLTYSVVVELNEKAQVVQQWFGKTIIHSDKRFTYEEVQAILDAQSGEFYTELNQLNLLAKKLRKTRFEQGSINFESEEIRFRLDDNFHPVEIIKKIRVDSHKLIEEFMLLANKLVASYVAQKRRKPPLPFVYRVHDSPDTTKLQQLAGFATHFGYKLNFDDEKQVSGKLNQLVDSIEGKPEQSAITQVMIRAMAKAVYSTENIGHYGLAFRYYTHFTSPIRRYPDILAHRLLTQYLSQPITEIGSSQTLKDQCQHCSEMEKKAADAERASVKYKQIEYMSQFIGRTFKGFISGITEFGIFVELKDQYCEGIVRLKDIAYDYFEFKPDKLCLIGRKSRKMFKLGDAIRIKVVKADVIKRQLDFILA
ncbi:MAG: ribonuclease R [Bacteroidia bacterium]|nr:ribonuclease R [Bacteroidia bacterium]